MTPCLVTTDPHKALGGTHCSFLYLKGTYKKDGEQLLAQLDNDRTKGSGFKLKEGKFRLEVRRKFSTQRVVRHWNRLPRELVYALFVEVFKTRLDEALGNLV